MINVNEYFEGKVKSLGYQTPEGKSTVGVMDEGEYVFGTTTHETMIVLEGELTVIMPGEEKAKVYAKGEKFEIPADINFKVKSKGQSSYLCKYK